MPRWLRMIRGIIVTGFTFAIGVGVATSMIGLPIWMLGGISLRSLFETVARFSLVSCVVGMAFSGLVAITARGRSIDKLSVPLFGALGAGVGFLYFLFMGLSGAFSAWSRSAAIINFLLVTVTGGASAAAILMLARRGRPELKGTEEPRNLDEG